MALQFRRGLELRGLTIELEPDGGGRRQGQTPDSKDDSDDEALAVFQPPAALQGGISPFSSAAPRAAKSARPSAGDVFQSLTGIDRQQGMGRKSSKLLHPDYPVMQLLTAVSTFLLVYVAIVVQVEVGFFWHESVCAPKDMNLMRFDVFVDCFFLLEILLKFFTGVWEEGRYHDSMLFVAQHYAKTGLIFDLVTSIPVTILEYAARLQFCGIDSGSGKPEHVKGGMVVRALKPLRVFKMAKLVRAGTVMVLLQKFEHFVGMPVFVARMNRAVIIIFFVVHTCSCVFWLVKESSNTEDQLEDFLVRYDVPVEGGLSLLEKYSLAFYFTNTIFSTVGFGDISAENTAERWALVVIMYVGVVVFGTLLSEVQNAIEDVYHLSRERQRVVNQVTAFLYSNDVPKDLADTIRSWVDFEFEYQQYMTQQKDIVAYVPEALRRSLHAHLHNDLLYRIPWLRDLTSPLAADLLLSLFTSMTLRTFLPGLSIVSRRSPADRCYFIMHGSVNVLLYDGSTVSTIHVGEHFGALALLAQDDCYLTDAGVPVEYVSKSRAVCLTLSRESFRSILDKFPKPLQTELSRASARVARLRLRQKSYFETHFQWYNNPRRLLVLQRWWYFDERLLINHFKSEAPGAAVHLEAATHNLDWNDVVHVETVNDVVHVETEGGQLNPTEAGTVSFSAGRASLTHSAHHGLRNHSHREALLAGDEQRKEGKVAVGDLSDIIAAAAQAAVDAQRQAEEGDKEARSARHVDEHGRGLPCYAEESIQWEAQTATSRRVRSTQRAHSLAEANSKVASPAMRPRVCEIGSLEHLPHGNGHASIRTEGLSSAFGAAAPEQAPEQRNHDAVMSRLQQLETMLLSHAEATRASFEQLEKGVAQMQQERAPLAPADASPPLRSSTSRVPQSHFAHAQAACTPPHEMRMEISDNAATSSALRARIRDSLSRAQLESQSTVPRAEHDC